MPGGDDELIDLARLGEVRAVHEALDLLRRLDDVGVAKPRQGGLAL